jgi:hypothetical protein
MKDVKNDPEFKKWWGEICDRADCEAAKLPPLIPSKKDKVERLRLALREILESAWEDEYGNRHHVDSDKIAEGWKALEVN